jgi:diaminobutyrate-2-oxoglutarate transaminase
MEPFDRIESAVRSYCRTFPTVFTRSRGSSLWDEAGQEYLDFFSGAGALNYGHNNPLLKRRILEYLEADGVAHSLDMATVAKRDFLERFERIVLRPRGLDHKVQFVGPTGTNAVEAALKLARKVTRRTPVVYFTDAYHGMTLGALAVTGNAAKRMGAGVPLLFTTPMPFDGYLGPQVDTVDVLATYLDDPASGLDKPAAVIVETVQAEGGLNVASYGWLQRLAALSKRHGILLIVDDIQVGCGRTGTFFSFERAGIEPDIVTLSKSISGYGLPMALVLMKPGLDVWAPGEHNGTFRGNNLAFVAGAEALTYWEDDTFARDVQRKGEKVEAGLRQIAADHPEARATVRGRGLIQGLACDRPGLAQEVAARCFERRLIIETAGPQDGVLKLLPPLVVEDHEIDRALRIIDGALGAALSGAGVERAELVPA